MINKKIVLGKNPKELGVKDAVHVAIVSVRAAHAMNPGTKCTINDNGEACSAGNKGVGIADPFLKSIIKTGQNFNLLLNPDEVDNVQHIWDHNKFTFDAPAKPVELNNELVEIADKFGVTYNQLLEAMDFVVENDTPAKYPGKKTQDELDIVQDDIYNWDLWSAYSDETLHEFDNIGTECCPEMAYPKCSIFKVQE